MTRRFTRFAALLGISSALAIGGIGLAQASPDHHGSGHDHHCKHHKHDCHHKGHK